MRIPKIQPKMLGHRAWKNHWEQTTFVAKNSPVRIVLDKKETSLKIKVRKPPLLER